MGNNEGLIIIRPAELFLKKGNRKQFEEQLIKNITFLLRTYNLINVKILNSVFLLKIENALNANKIAHKISKYVTGCANVSIGFVAEKSKNSILERVNWILKKNNLQKNEKRTFRVTVHRHHKIGFYNSIDLQKIVGAEIVAKTKNTVNLTKYEFEIRIELFKNFVVVCEKTIQGIGGLPVPTSGITLHLLSAGFDSPTASYLLQTRGMHADYIHFHIENIANNESIKKVKKQIENLKQFQQRSKINLFLVNVNLLYNEIICSCPNQYRLLILKYFFLYISNSIKTSRNYDAISTGESLGQVSTQTISNLNFLYQDYEGFPLTPLIGLSKIKILEIAKLINSLKITLIPGDDLCKNFVGKHQTHKIKNQQKFYKILRNPLYTEIAQEIIKKRIHECKI